MVVAVTGDLLFIAAVGCHTPCAHCQCIKVGSLGDQVVVQAALSPFHIRLFVTIPTLHPIDDLLWLLFAVAPSISC